MSTSHCKITIDLDAIAHNWRVMNTLAGDTVCSAVVKADAYGLGVKRVAPRLYREGCRDFFVASLQEASSLKPLIPADARIYILAGVYPGEERACLLAGFIPVLVSLEMLKRWVVAKSEGASQVNARPQNAVLKVDTGMARLGLTESEFSELLTQPELIEKAGVTMLMSHLACADEPEHPFNQVQLARFDAVVKALKRIRPDIKSSLANSAGMLLGRDYWADMVRPGIALYGSNLNSSALEQIRHVVRLSMEVIQVRKVPAGAPVGYGASSVSDEERFIATVAGGYADGVFRCLSNKGAAFVQGTEVAVAGRISMDTTLFDVTQIAHLFTESPWPQIELLGAEQGIDELAETAGTVGYEILTSLGERFGREYVEQSNRTVAQFAAPVSAAVTAGECIEQGK